MQEIEQPEPMAQKQNADGINISKIERWVSLIGGGALVLLGLKRRSVGGAGIAVMGGGLLLRGATGHCPAYGALGVNTSECGANGIHVEKSVTINKSPEELYRFWHDFENLPRFMEHLESVKRIDATRSHWVAKAPADTQVSWDAEIIAEKENAWISWRSLEGSQIPNAGHVRFEPAPAERGTVVRVTLEYAPPAGKIGAAFAKLFGEEPSQQVEKDLRRFKQLMETGEIPTTIGQPAGRSLKRQMKAAILPSAESRTLDEEGTVRDIKPHLKSHSMEDVLAGTAGEG